MNDASDNDPLLQELLPGDQMEAFRVSSLQRLLKAAEERRQRRRARNSVISTSMAVVALLGLLVVATEVRKGNQLQTATAGNTHASTALRAAEQTTPVVRNGVRILSDDELLGMFRGQRVALVGGSGGQRLVFLERRTRNPVPPP
jgi:hypothetical protein